MPYADLAFLVADVVEPGVGTAAKLILNSTIENVKKDCRKMAEASESQTKAFYRPDANAAWQTVQFSQGGNLTYDVIVPRPALDNGANDNKKEDYNLTTAGYYKFATAADEGNKVKEDNEGNNTAETRQGQVSRLASGHAKTFNLEIYIAPDPKRGIKPASKNSREKVVIEYLGYH